MTDPGEVEPPPSFDEFQRQTSLMTSCTLLWKELSDHFTSLEQDLERKSAALKDKFKSLDDETKLYLEELDERESSLESTISAALGKVESSKKVAMDMEGDGDGEVDDSEGEAMRLRGFCVRMDFKSFWGFVVVRKKELESLRKEIPKALGECVDPPKFVLEAISEVFPVNQGNRNGSMSGYGFDMGWACVLLLESLIPVMMDPVLGRKRMLVTPKIRREAEEIAEIWKRSLEERGGIENVKTPDVHTFLQHLVTFGIVKRQDLELYRKLVVASAWRKQMPKLAVSLGLGHKMPDMIEELISRGQQVDAVHFSFEVGLVDKYPPVPLLKAFLKDAKKMATSILEDPNNSGRATHLAGKKEQSALRAVIKCIEEYKLDAEFPPEPLKKRLEQLERSKAEKRKPVSVPANKRTRANNGGPMPPAKAGRLTNAYVSSFPPPPAFVRSPTYSSPSYSSPSYSSPSYSSPSYSSPTYTQYPTGMPTYPSPPAMYGNRSPQYAYSPEAYPPVGYPTYGGYGPGMAPASPAYHQQAYY